LGRISEASAALLTYRAGKAKSEEKTRPGIEPTIIRAELDLAQGDRELTILAANQVLTLIRNGTMSQYQTSWEMQASLLAGKAELELGHANDALPFLKRALDLGADLYDPLQSPRYADAQIALAECLLELRRIEEARKLYAGATAIHVIHKELADRYRKPLQQLKAHLAAS
jgi:tetratricopeptide (TPR) repeat protein